MQFALQLPVPSRNLLRFLRLQSEGVPFFHPSAGPACASRRHRPVQSIHDAFQRSAKIAPTVRSKRAEATLQAGLWDVGSFIPKSLRKQRTSFDATAIPETRLYSTDRKPDALKGPTWHERLWGWSQAARGGSGSGLGFDDGDDMSDPSSMFNRRRIQTAKAALEPRLRCTEVDENGKVILNDGEFKKSELIAKVRDEHKAMRDQAMLTVSSTVYYHGICERSIPPTFPISLSVRKQS